MAEPFYSLDIDEVKLILTELEKLDLKSATKDIIIGILTRLLRHAGVVTRLQAGTVICRTVSCNHLKGEYPTKASQISYNPDLIGSSFGRANWAGNSVFYGCISSEFIAANDATYFELLDNLIKNPADIAQELFVVGTWVLQQDLDVITLSGNFKVETDADKSRNAELTLFLTDYPENREALNLIDRFLCNEFSKEVSRQENWRYKISAAYAEFLKQDNWPGLIYPSYQSQGAGINIMLYSDVVDKRIIQLVSAVGVLHYKRGIRHLNEYTLEAVTDGYDLTWRELNKYKLTDEMRSFITGKSDFDPFEGNVNYIDFE